MVKSFIEKSIECIDLETAAFLRILSLPKYRHGISSLFTYVFLYVSQQSTAVFSICVLYFLYTYIIQILKQDGISHKNPELRLMPLV